MMDRQLFRLQHNAVSAAAGHGLFARLGLVGGVLAEGCSHEVLLRAAAWQCMMQAHSRPSVDRWIDSVDTAFATRIICPTVFT